MDLDSLKEQAWQEALAELKQDYKDNPEFIAKIENYQKSKREHESEPEFLKKLAALEAKENDRSTDRTPSQE